MLRRRLPALLLFLFGPVAYHGILTPGWALVDYDIFLYFEPYRQALAHAWAQGRLVPLWNSGIYLGAPFLANIQAAALYPPNLLLLVMPPEQAIAWLIALHAGLAGAGMFLYAQTALRLRVAGSLAAGAVYMLNAHLVMHAGHLNQSNTLGWTPWLMLATDRAALRPAPRRLAAVAALVALVILAGHTQQAYFTFLLAALAGLMRLWRGRARGLRSSLVRLAALVGSVVLGAGITALQLAATIELTRQSVRSGGLPIDEAGAFALPVRGVLGNLLPDYVGEHQAEYAASIGAVALALVVLALLARFWRSWPWALLGFISLIAAFGPRAKVYTVLYHLLPGLALFRVPSRLLVFAMVAAAVLAGEGVKTLVQLHAAGKRRRQTWSAPAAAVVATALIFVLVAAAAHRSGLGEGKLVLFPPAIDPINWMRPLELLAVLAVAGGAALRWRPAALALPALVVIDLLLLAAPTYPMNPLPDSLYQARPAGLDLVSTSTDQRYLAMVPFEAQLSEADRVPGGLSPLDQQRYAGYLHQLDPLVPDHGMATGPLDADGYDGGLLPTRGYVDFRRPLLPGDSSNQPDFTDHLLTDRAWSCDWLRQAAVTTVLTAGVDPNPPGQSCLVRTADERGLTAWELDQPLPRAHLEDGTPARIVSDSGEQVTVAVPPGATGRLILADTWYPGWTAHAAGRTLSVQKTGGYLQAVDLPPGATEVTFEYRPGWLLPAGIASLLALLVVAGMASRAGWPGPRRT